MLIYHTIWKEFTGLSIPAGWCIHHIDGNHNNNNPLNLECVSSLVHWCIHFLQGDVVALRGKFIQGAAEAGKLGGRKNRGRKQLPEHIAKRIPKTQSIESNIKRSTSLMGHSTTPESNTKRSIALKGKPIGPHSLESNLKRSITQKGRPLGPRSPEHQAKLNASRIKNNALKRLITTS